MSLGAAAGLIVLGLALLAGGGDVLIRGATSVARIAGLTPAVIGLTVVAMGTSLPELTVSVLASLEGRPDIAVGNVVGSNIFNIAAILGVSALVAPLPIRWGVIKLEWPVMFLVSCAFLLVARDGVIDRLEAGVFLAGLVTFVAWSVYLAREEVSAEQARQLEQEVAGLTPAFAGRDLAWAVLLVLLGIGALVLGGKWLVQGAVGLAQLAGMSERVIGLTIVAAGTSAPEVAASVAAALRRQSDIAVANLIGSNIFNILGILGAAGVIAPLAVAPGILRNDAWWMIGVASLVLPLMMYRMNLSRLEGGLLLASYGVYLYLLLR